MIKKIKGSVLYDYWKLNYKVVLFFSIILMLFVIYAINDYINMDLNVRDKNVWDFYCLLYIDTDIVAAILTLLSLYFTLISFESPKSDMFFKIRVNNLFTGFTAKVIGIFIFNLIISMFATITVIAIGSIFLGFQLNWGKVALRLREFSHYYNPVKIVLINMFIYSVFSTFLSQIIGFFIMSNCNKKIISTVSIIYIVFETFSLHSRVRALNFLKYISLYFYTNIGNRDFKSLGGNLTLKEGFVVPIILLIVTFAFIRLLFSNRRIRRGLVS